MQVQSAHFRAVCAAALAAAARAALERDFSAEWGITRSSSMSRGRRLRIGECSCSTRACITTDRPG